MFSRLVMSCDCDMSKLSEWDDSLRAPVTFGHVFALKCATEDILPIGWQPPSYSESQIFANCLDSLVSGHGACALPDAWHPT